MYEDEQGRDVRLRRKNVEPEVEVTPEPAGPTPDQVESGRSDGPWDAREVDLEEAAGERVDLGALLLKGRSGLELRMQIDEASQVPMAALILAQDAAVELRPFASSRGPEFWDEVRGSIAEQVRAQGGQVEETEGPWGPELRAVINAVGPDGAAAIQPSRLAGIRGPRWLLRATFFGVLAEGPNPDHLIEQVVRDVVVVRPVGALAPGEALPLRLPPGAPA